jgi:hypothetical protein
MPSWTPSPADVKSEIPQRVGGEEFTPNTTPTVTQVQLVIDKVVAEVVGEVGPFDPMVVLNPTAPVEDRITLGDLAKNAAALGAASRIEDQFFPEQQIATGMYGVHADGGNQHLYARYRRAVEVLKHHLAVIVGADVPFTGSVSTPLTTVVTRARTLDTP